MKMAFINQKVKTAWKSIRPWIMVVVILVIMRYTGILAGISYVTGSVLLKTGAMNASTEEPIVAKNFNYDFKIKTLEGRITDVNEFKGKVIFLNVWATWCGPCRVEMPSIQKLYDKVDKDKVAFVMLAVDDRKSFDKVVNFVDDKEYTFPVYVPHESLPEQLMVRTIPTTFVIDKDGKIAAKETGTANYDTEEFKSFLENLASAIK